MNKQQAEQTAAEITKLLTGKSLIAVEVFPQTWNKIRVNPNSSFRNCYLVDYKDGRYSIGLSDSYGVMTGSEKWTITENSVIAETTNTYGETLLFCWHVTTK